MEKIRKGDEVIVIAGKDKGKRGAVLRLVGAEHVVIDGINRVKKHVKPNPMKGEVGGVVDKDMPLHISNVALYNPTTKKADRVGFKLLDETGKNGKKKKVRIFKSNGEAVAGV